MSDVKIGKVISILRKERNLAQKELAECLGLSVGTISNYENSVHFPDLETVIKLAEYFGVSTDYLLGRVQHRCDYQKLQDYKLMDFAETMLSIDEKGRDSVKLYAEFMKFKKQREEGSTN